MDTFAFSDIHCSFGQERSFVDPVSNWAVIEGVEIDRHLANVMQAGKYPVRFLPDFLHEATHHWCFHSAVGQALALLQMRARRRVLLYSLDDSTGGLEEEELFDTVGEDVVRYLVAIGLMRPLAEGLALYAESDAFPGESLAMSSVMDLALRRFLTPSEKNKDLSILDQFRVMISNFRLGNSLRERKAGVLCGPFSALNGGNSPGYLLVKSLWNSLIAHGDKLLDTDFYLTFLRSFIYEDFGFVATLLEPDRKLNPLSGSPSDPIQAINLYFQKRIAELLKLDMPTVLDGFEQAVLARKTKQRWRDLQAGDTGELWDHGEQLHMELVDNLVFDGPPVGREDTLRRNDNWAMAQRDLLCIGNFRAKVQVNEHGMVWVGEYKGDIGVFKAPIFAIRGTQGALPGKDDGSIAFFLSLNQGYQLETVTRGDELVFIGSLDDVSSDEIRDLAQGFEFNLDSAISEGKMWRELVDEFFAGHTFWGDYLEFYRESVNSIVETFYLPRAIDTPDDALQQTIATLAEKGFRSVLNGGEVRALSWLSLVNSYNLTRSYANKTLQEDGLSAEEFFQKLQDAQSQLQLTLYREADDFILFHV